MNSNYSAYTNWCLAEMLVPDGQNHFLEVTGDIMIECTNRSLLEQSIITRSELKRYADTSTYFFHSQKRKKTPPEERLKCLCDGRVYTYF